MAAPTRTEIRQLAANVLAKHGTDPSISAQVEALLGSSGDTLSNKEIFEELTAIEKGGFAWLETFATNSKADR